MAAVQCITESKGCPRGEAAAYLSLDIKRICRGELECLRCVSALTIGSSVHSRADEAVNA